MTDTDGGTLGKLAADHLVELWQEVQKNTLSEEAFHQQEQRLVSEYREIWKRALLLEGEGTDNLLDSFFLEFGKYLGNKTRAEVEEWRQDAVAANRAHWRVERDRRETIERFYNECEIELYNLSHWHTLTEDVSPLAYVTALKFAQQHGCRTHLDFGCGVGSGSILFAQHGFDVVLADISSPYLRYGQWRMELRGLSGRFLDLKKCHLPSETFDFVTAMDVFEHLFDPIGAVDRIWSTLKPGGFLFGRFHTEPGDTHDTHVVRDFRPTFDHMREVGFVEVWRDKWFWGHQAFQKRCSTDQPRIVAK